MSSAAGARATGATGSARADRATRDPRGRWIAGVATGLSDHFGWPLPLIRVGFLILALANGIGIVLYLGLWAVMPLRPDPAGRRDSELGRMLAFGAVVLGVLLLASVGGWGYLQDYAAPVLVLGLGAAMLWQQFGSRDGTGLADPARDGTAPIGTAPIGTAAIGTAAIGTAAVGTAARRDRFSWVRPALGMALVAAGLIALLVGEIGWTQGLQALLVVLLLSGGAALVALPWLVGGYRDLVAERRALIREQERTEIAARVHDSVLQTLTLIQHNAGDPNQVARLARSEERRLRSWLYQPAGSEPDSLAAAIGQAAETVEQDYGAVIEVVQVGDEQMSPPVRAIVAATTEAMVNAAKHTGPRARISVYCECSEPGVDRDPTQDSTEEDPHGRSVQVFVKDRGGGFEPASVPDDRHGVRGSIVERMNRAGGRAEVVTGPTGTEVRLSLSKPGSAGSAGNRDAAGREAS